MFFNSPLVVESSINGHLLGRYDVWSFIVKKCKWGRSTKWCKKRWLDVIIHDLNIFGNVFRWHIICVLWCFLISSPPQASTSSTIDLKLCEWAQFFFINNHVIRKKLLITKWFVAVTEISSDRAASCNSFQTSVCHLLRLLKANLLETASLWRCVCKCLLALRVRLSPNIPALLTNSVAVITGGAKVEHILQYYPFSQLLK